jgi:hypothetical protein
MEDLHYGPCHILPEGPGSRRAKSCSSRGHSEEHFQMTSSIAGLGHKPGLRTGKQDLMSCASNCLSYRKFERNALRYVPTVLLQCFGAVKTPRPYLRMVLLSVRMANHRPISQQSRLPVLSSPGLHSTALGRQFFLTCVLCWVGVEAHIDNSRTANGTVISAAANADFVSRAFSGDIHSGCSFRRERCDVPPYSNPPTVISQRVRAVLVWLIDQPLSPCVECRSQEKRSGNTNKPLLHQPTLDGSRLPVSAHSVLWCI